MIDISSLDKSEVLAALYNRARPQGMGYMHFDPKPMTTEEARAILDGENNAAHTSGFWPGYHASFDYLHGRVMKVNLSGDSFREDLYDRDNGEGAAAKAVDSIRAVAVATAS